MIQAERPVDAAARACAHFRELTGNISRQQELLKEAQSILEELGFSTREDATPQSPEIAATFSAHDTDSSCCELDDEPPPPRGRQLGRRFAISEEAFGEFNRYMHIQRQCNDKTDEQRQMLEQVLHSNGFYSGESQSMVDSIVDACVVEEHEADACAVCWHENNVYFVLDGRLRLYSPRHTNPKGDLLKTVNSGRILNERSPCKGRSQWSEGYALGRCTVGVLDRTTYRNHRLIYHAKVRERLTQCLRKVTVLETLNDEQIQKLVDVLREVEFDEDEDILQQGDMGSEFYIVLSGECSATVAEGNDVQEHRRYTSGSIFGEMALLTGRPRQATVTALTHVEALELKGTQFERLFGPIQHLLQQNYLTDPRKHIADFYKLGDARGPDGACARSGDLPKGGQTAWFAVFRPTSRDAISRMLNGEAVGKGLNVKGKSAKRNRLSGFVPFVQISKNEHKADIEPPHPKARVRIYYQSKGARDAALTELQQLQSYAGEGSDSYDSDVVLQDDYSPDHYGLDVPEALVHLAYITGDDVDLRPPHDWETGRESCAEFMDMNLHALRDGKPPKVVLLQYDSNNPMNCHGLLVAYAETHVKPVVSDFDAFTVGSRGMPYEPPLTDQQAELARLSLEWCRGILESPAADSWTSRWLDVLKQKHQELQDFRVELPRFGFGDETSYKLVEQVVDATCTTGAVRHGAECFNFSFPQELDDQYLIVWEGFASANGVPWEYKSEPEMRDFLKDRIAEGFCFPLNPIWPLRDPGWWDIFEALRNSQHGHQALKAWYRLPDSGLCELMDEIHTAHPRGFAKAAKQSGIEHAPSTRFEDTDVCEQADLGAFRFRKYQRSLLSATRKLQALRRLSTTSLKAMKSS